MGEEALRHCCCCCCCCLDPAWFYVAAGVGAYVALAGRGVGHWNDDVVCVRDVAQSLEILYQMTNDSVVFFVVMTFSVHSAPQVREPRQQEVGSD